MDVIEEEVSIGSSNTRINSKDKSREAMKESSIHNDTTDRCSILNNPDTHKLNGKASSDCATRVKCKEIRASGANGANTSDSGLHDDCPRGKIVWRNVIIYSYFHLAALYGALMIVKGQIKYQTLIFAWFLYILGGLGATAGSHRYYSHRAYKAKIPLRVLLVFFQTLAFQNSLWEWVRDHRVHHKYSETNADPHNARRGFFFSHVGWLLCRKHELVRVKGKNIDLSDIESDQILMFQKKYYLPLGLSIAFFLPACVPYLLWDETFFGSFMVASVFRYAVTLHFTWLVNSAAHLWGSRPYDKGINPAENRIVAILAWGEGWHNYHHTFPWDYKTAELGHYRYNLTTAFIDSMAAIGWAYDLKTVQKKVIRERVARTGDGSWIDHDHAHREGAPWGWGDEAVPESDAIITETLFPMKVQ